MSTPMSAAPHQQSSPSADPAAAVESIPAAGSNQRAGESSTANTTNARFPSASAIKTECAGASPEAMSAAIRAEISDLTSDLSRLGGLLSAAPSISALVHERIAFLEATLHSLRRWSSLYSDALHSIFEFASLDDLSRLARVSHRWSDAVLNVPLMGVCITIVSEEHLAAVLASRLRHHVSCLYQHNQRSSGLYPLSASELHDVSVALPELTNLSVALWDADVEPAVCALPRFRCLWTLTVAFPGWMEAADCNRVIQAIGKLNPETMEKLTLQLPSQIKELSFAPLTALTRLSNFSFTFAAQVQPLTDAHLHALRALSSIRDLRTPYKDASRADFLARLLQPGHRFRWSVLGSLMEIVQVTEALAPVVGSLRTLTHLEASLQSLDVRFFAELPQLTDLMLASHLPELDLAAFVQSLAHCTGLTHLSLFDFDLSGQHLEALLPALPRLSFLSLHRLPLLSSLRCFDSPSLAASLTSLRLLSLRTCPPTEVTHLFGLVSLESLDIDWLQTRMTDELRAEFCVPSPRLPALQSSHVLCREDV